MRTKTRETVELRGTWWPLLADRQRINAQATRMFGAAWTFQASGVQGPARTTDQKVGGSNPSERAESAQFRDISPEPLD
jgi:hypothetical protein